MIEVHPAQVKAGGTTLDGYQVRYIPDEGCPCEKFVVVQAIGKDGTATAISSHFDGQTKETRRENKRSKGGHMPDGYTKTGRVGDQPNSYRDAPYFGDSDDTSKWMIETCAFCREKPD